ncbi:PadR family transcriptional regulator [Virgisporangium ochraceum]|uniref:PadR family transcriptional regulator n=1 Tax=Virgisporangium ochraceum TaxID=65505 RepID=A0A8J3ZUY4_9ACTN|nr:PadR family transcriptional regulator [Virgisporangium ochraceum]GIJ70126.1 PadR family transcriptional regulator [Virgisporangium ochraceum]
MSVSRTLLGLLEPGAQHGYTLRQRYDVWFGAARPLKSAQVYSTLQRLQRDGLADLAGVAAGEGPDRRLYAITGAGVYELDRWLQEPEVPEVSATRRALFAKVVLALHSGRPARALLDAQRQAHHRRLREMRVARQRGDLMAQLDADFEMYHLDADLKWIDGAEARLDRLAAHIKETDHDHSA